MSAPNWIDRAIGVVSPRAMLRRVEARAGAAALTGALAAYDGASRGYRTAARTVSRADANAEIRNSLARLRDVHRDLVRNNPYAARAVSSRVTNTVGGGIVPSVVARSARSKARVTDLVKAHLQTTAIDFEGRTNLFGLQALAERTRSESGEALIVRYWPKARDMADQGLSMPLQIRVLEGDYLDQAKHGPLPDGGFVFMGVEFNPAGIRRGYWLFDEHPNGRDVARRGYSRLVSTFVPATEVIHYYHQLRPGQVRGIPDGTPVIMTAWDLAEYEDARLLREKIAACFTMFWTRGESPTNLAQGAASAERAAGLKIADLAPGLMQELPQGSTVTFGQPPATQGHAEYVTAGVRRIAIGYDLPFEEVGGDLTQVSFLSGRLGEIHLSRRVEQWQQHSLIPQVCDGVARWFVQAAALKGAPPFRLEWTAPRREMLSPKDEIPAKRDAIRAGLTSRQEEIRKLGYDPEQVDAEQAEDNARADKADLAHDSDGRRPQRGPNLTQTEPPTDPTPPGGAS
jgi:lambda family phage portal protein